MGVNAIIMLPHDSRLNDVTQVIGILAGLPAEKQDLGSGSYSCHVAGAEAKTSCLPEMASIEINGELVDGEQNHFTTWHWEPERGNGDRMLYPKSTAFWIAVGRKLVDFFGGSIVYSDCNGDEPNYTATKPRRSNKPTNGKPWHDFQDEKLALKPITQKDLASADRVAAYKMEKVA